MTCPQCGGPTPLRDRRCTTCGHTVAPVVATGVLTPLPQDAPDLIEFVDDTTGHPDRRRGSNGRPLPEDLEVTGMAMPVDVDVTGMGAGTLPGADAMTFASDAPTGVTGSAPAASTGPLALGQKFGPRYQILKLLGVGGMGAVYQAWDSELDVVVAVKVIRAETTSDPTETRAIERRFKQELLLARQVTHKNVVRIHDLGEIDGIKYITMSYVEGSDLATVLKEAGKLPVREALRIARQVASGLQAAHEAGVVHRDLKPANIMVEKDRAIIMDFGIARSAHSAPTLPNSPGAPALPRGHSAAQTMAGTIVGTIAYMAPEQARGEAVDQRADIYALGLIVADMLLGRRVRGREQSAFEELQRRMREPLPLLRATDATIPPAVEQIVARCVDPDPNGRFQTTAELVAALDRLDEDGKPIPLVRRLTPRMMAAAAVLVTALLTGTFYVTRLWVEPVKTPDPVSLVIADFDNRTNDATFDRTLEPMLRRALEGAGFINAFDRIRVGTALGARPEKLDETTAREIAVKQGLGVVLAGSIAPQGSGYALSMRAIHTVTGNEIVNVQGRASGKDDVLPAANRLVARIRTALGDVESEADQIFAMTSLSVTSLDVVKHYAEGMAAQSNNRFEEARQSFARAVELDPKFGLAYSSLAGVSRNLGRVQDAENYSKQALQFLDGMSERERFSTRGFYYRVTGDYQQCVKEYGDLVARYAADIVGRNQRALCLSKLRDMRGAVEEMKQVVAILPNRPVFRDNLALYSNYAGDFESAEKEARTVGAGDPFALLALAFSQVGRADFTAATETYKTLAAMSPLGASMAASGLADIAAVHGRYDEAVQILEAAVAVDLSGKNSDRASTKLAAVANAELLRGRHRAAVAAADKALTNSRAVKIRYLAARTYIEAGEPQRAQPFVDQLALEIQGEPQAYAKLLEGEMHLKAGRAKEAIKAFTDANALLDTWMGHFGLGRAYLAAEAYIQADSALDRCVSRRGESLSLFVDEDPTHAFFPAVYYYQGRVREAMKSAAFAESYRQYLALRGDARDDVLAADARQRAR